MAYLQVGARQYPLVPGENGIGSVEGSRIPVPASHGDPNEMSAVVVVEADGSSIIRRTGAADVTVNGVQLGAEPTPLIHGDKIDVGSTELFFGDDRKAGNTSFVAAVKRPEAASAPAAKRLWVVDYGSTGGRLVSLVDGREYVVPDEGLVVGRDPACDVVVPTGEVSRKHAVIAAGPGGYMITDLSANGLSVNGGRVERYGVRDSFAADAHRAWCAQRDLVGRRQRVGLAREAAAAGRGVVCGRHGIDQRDLCRWTTDTRRSAARGSAGPARWRSQVHVSANGCWNGVWWWCGRRDVGCRD